LFLPEQVPELHLGPEQVIEEDVDEYIGLKDLSSICNPLVCGQPLQELQLT
jgi:hypothetical protein